MFSVYLDRLPSLSASGSNARLLAYSSRGGSRGNASGEPRPVAGQGENSVTGLLPFCNVPSARPPGYSNEDTREIPFAG